jgi:hypothetical protein
MHRIQLAACIALLAAGVIACGLLREPVDPVINGWPVGGPLDCAARPDCALLIDLARSQLHLRDRDHAPVTRVSLHAQGALVDPATGDRILQTRSGGQPMIVVFELEDGSVTAIAVGYPGISREPMIFESAP